MSALLTAVTSWPSLVLVLVVFGFAPGFCLRLIVLAYPRNDPRRDELVAELYAVPRIERPLWVAEQLEVALFEGLRHRVRARRVARKGVVADRRGRGIWIWTIGFTLLVIGYLFGIPILVTLGILTVTARLLTVMVSSSRIILRSRRAARKDMGADHLSRGIGITGVVLLVIGSLLMIEIVWISGVLMLTVYVIRFIMQADRGHQARRRPPTTDLPRPGEDSP
jgi:hypothetical protein